MNQILINAPVGLEIPNACPVIAAGSYNFFIVRAKSSPIHPVLVFKLVGWAASIVRVPECCNVILTRCKNKFSVVAESSKGHRVRLFFETVYICPRESIPHSDDAIFAGSDDSRSVRAEPAHVNLIVMRQGMDVSERHCVPNHRLVCLARYQN